MRLLAAILALLAGCGLLDKTVQVSSLIPPGDSIRVPAMVYSEPPPTFAFAKPPVICLWSMACDEVMSADLDQSGCVDGDDLWVYFMFWVDCTADDVDRNGCPDADNDGSGDCDECDTKRFFEVWEQGI